MDEKQVDRVVLLTVIVGVSWTPTSPRLLNLLQLVSAMRFCTGPPSCHEAVAHYVDPGCE